MCRSVEMQNIINRLPTHGRVKELEVLELFTFLRLGGQTHGVFSKRHAHGVRSGGKIKFIVVSIPWHPVLFHSKSTGHKVKFIRGQYE